MRRFAGVGLLRVIGTAVVSVLGLLTLLWGALGVSHVIRLLHHAPPAEPKEPETRLAQVVTRFRSGMRGWALVFSAAVVGAAISDYDRDPHRGLGRMLGLFLFVTAGIALVTAVALGRAGRQAAIDQEFTARTHDPAELLVSCTIGGLAVALGLAIVAVNLM